MNTRPDDSLKTKQLPRTDRSGRPSTILNTLVKLAIVASVGSYGVVLTLGAGEGGSSAVGKSAPKRLSLDNVTVSQIDKSTPTPTDAETASAESIWQLDEPNVITADMTESSDGDTVTPVVELQELTVVPQRLSNETAGRAVVESDQAGKSRVWMPIPTPSAETSVPSGKARVSRPSVVVASHDSATGRARVSLPAPVERPQPKSGRSYVSEPLPPKRQVERQEASKLAQLSQPETKPVPKKDVPPSPVPETTDNPDNDTLEYAGFKPIGELTVNISEKKGEDPEDLARPEFEKVEPVVLDTEWIDQKLTAPTFAFYHQPLYFEDPNAERCGETWGILQPAVSAAQFYLTIPALPYLIGALPPNEPVESLGDCAWGCKYRYRDAYLPPLSLKGAALQGAAVTGLIFLIP